MYKLMKIWMPFTAALVLACAGCNKEQRSDAQGGPGTGRETKTSVGDQKDQIDSAAKEAKRQIEQDADAQKKRIKAEADAAKKQLEAQKAISEAQIKAQEKNVEAQSKRISESVSSAQQTVSDSADRAISDLQKNGAEIVSRVRQSLNKFGTAIDANVNDGVVTLNGTVESEQARQEAEDLAKKIRGVTRVENNLKVVRP
jgi:hyperosmotically inducible periplasmic protein